MTDLVRLKQAKASTSELLGFFKSCGFTQEVHHCSNVLRLDVKRATRGAALEACSYCNGVVFYL
jgi:hypothetical protein